MAKKLIMVHRAVGETEAGVAQQGTEFENYNDAYSYAQSMVEEGLWVSFTVQVRYTLPPVPKPERLPEPPPYKGQPRQPMLAPVIIPELPDLSTLIPPRKDA